VGQYQLFEKLGDGGMGTVYKALHVRLKRVVALKVLAPGRLSDPEARARFVREMEVVASLDHPNVVRATDGGESDGQHFLVMDYVEGIDLAELAHRAGPLPVAEACELARQAAVALHYIHTRGLVHRDVKPSNLMATPDGQLKVLDLGLARLRGDGQPDRRLTGAGEVIGTADYMAPEQATDARRVDPRTDLYALGCTLYHLLAGRPPFDDPAHRSAFQKLTGHAQEPPPALRSRRPDVPEGLAAVVHRLIAKDPADRPAAAADVALALAPHAAGADLPALAAVARQKAAPGQGAAGSAVERPGDLDGVTSAATWRARPAAPAPAAARRRLRPTLALAAAAALVVGLGAVALTGRPPRAGVGGPDGVADELTPQVWHPLLGRPPTELLWSHERRDWQWAFDGQKEELRMDCPGGPGMLRVGEVRRTGYRLRVDIGQDRWTGGVGIFFGYGQGACDNVPCLRYQFLQLRPGLPRDPARAFVLCRGIEYLPLPGAVGLLGSDCRDFMSVPVQLPEQGDQKLELLIEPQGLVSVRWGRAELAALAAPEINAGLDESQYLGQFGVLGNSCEGVFHNYRIMLLEDGPR
jgi:hypothetical protein